MKKRIKKLIFAGLGMLPFALVSRFFHWYLEASSQCDPKSGLKRLFLVQESLENAINQVAVKFGEGVHPKHRLMNYHDFFLGRVRADETVLDIGCGNGEVAFDIAKKTCGRVVGIDLEGERIRQAKIQYCLPNLSFICGDAVLELPGETFDVIVLSNVLEHIEQRVGFLVNLARKLKPRRILIRVPAVNRDWQVALKKELGLFYFSDQTHFIEYDRETFQSEINQAGLRILHMESCWGELWAEVATRGEMR